MGNTIRKIALSTGEVETVAGNDSERVPLDGDGLAARFAYLRSMVAFGSDLLVADRCAIRKVSTVPPYTVTTIFGTAAGETFSCSPILGSVLDIAVHGSDLYLLDSFGGAIWKGSLGTSPFTPTLVAGSPGELGFSDGTLATARFNQPTGIIFPSPTSPDFYVSDSFYSDDGSISWATIRRVSPAENSVATIAGSPRNAQESVDGLGTRALFNAARRLVSDGKSVFTGDFYAIRRIDLATRAVVTIAGGNTPGSADGAGTAAQFSGPYGLALGSGGVLYVADQGNYTIRQLTP